MGHPKRGEFACLRRVVYAVATIVLCVGFWLYECASELGIDGTNYSLTRLVISSIPPGLRTRNWSQLAESFHPVELSFGRTQSTFAPSIVGQRYPEWQARTPQTASEFLDFYEYQAITRLNLSLFSDH